MNKKIIAGIALVAFFALMFTMSCIDCDRVAVKGVTPGYVSPGDTGGITNEFVMYGKNEGSTPYPVYSYVLRNYSDYDVVLYNYVVIDTNGILDTFYNVSIPKRANSEYHSHTFRSSHDGVTIKYYPSDKVRFEPEGIAFVRFFNRY